MFNLNFKKMGLNSILGMVKSQLPDVQKSIEELEETINKFELQHKVKLQIVVKMISGKMYIVLYKAKLESISEIIAFQVDELASFMLKDAEKTIKQIKESLEVEFAQIELSEE